MRGAKKRNEKKVTVKRSGYWTLLVSFLMMLLIPVCLIITDFQYTKKNIEEETVRYNQALLIQTQDLIDEKLQNILRLGFSLAENQSLTDFLYSTNLESGDLYVGVNRVRDILRNSEVIYSEISGSVIYSDNYQVAISSETAIYGEKYSSVMALLFYNKEEIPEVREQLVDYLSEGGYIFTHYQTFSYQSNEEKTLQKVYLIQNLPLGSGTASCRGLLIIDVNIEYLLEYAGGSILDEGGAFGLVDSEGNVIAGIGDIELLSEGYSKAFSDGNTRFEKTGIHYFVNTESSMMNGWTYVIVQSEESYLGRLKIWRNSVLALLIIFMVLGMVMACCLSKRNYRPVSQISRRMQKLVKCDAYEARNEFSFIEHALDNMESSMDEARQVMEEAVPQVRSGLLEKLLLGTIDDYRDLEDKMRKYGVIFSHDTFLVVLICIDMFPTDRLDRQAMLKLLLSERIQNLWTEKKWNAQLFIVDMSFDQFALIVNRKGCGLSEMVQNVLEELMDLARKELELLLSVAVGSPVNSIEQIPSVYQQLQIQVMNKRGREEFGTILSETSDQKVFLYSFSEESRERLSRYIMAGQEEEVDQLLDENYHENFDNHAIDKSVSVSYFIMLINVILNCRSVPEQEMRIILDRINPVEEVLKSKTPEQMEQVTKDFAAVVTDYVCGKRKQHVDSLRQRITAYIEQEYADENLSLSSVADHFMITSNYLSSFFSEQTGETFMNYVTSMRMAKAKELLRTTELPVGKIAAMSGYSSDNSFIRAFKRIEHMTPGEYRRNMK